MTSKTQKPQPSEAQRKLALAQFEKTLAEVSQRQEKIKVNKNIWLSHHWPQDYAQRCTKIGRHQVCRRCSALYPLGFLIAFLSAVGYKIWPDSADPALIWILCVPATVAYAGEALGLFAYNSRWQVATMLLAAAAFGKAIGYELQNRWSPEFWQPAIVFGLIWGFATIFANGTKEL